MTRARRPRAPGSAARRAAQRGERGAAVAEFAMVSGLVVLLGLAVVQLGLALYVRNVLIACASEGARLGARADAQPADGARRSRELISDSLSPRFADHVTVQLVDDGPVAVVAVHVVAPLPVAGMLGPDGSIEVVGRAFEERQ